MLFEAQFSISSECYILTFTTYSDCCNHIFESNQKHAINRLIGLLFSVIESRRLRGLDLLQLLHHLVMLSLPFVFGEGGGINLQELVGIFDLNTEYPIGLRTFGTK